MPWKWQSESCASISLKSIALIRKKSRIPEILTGVTDLSPGPWAEFIIQKPFPFPVAINGSNLRGDSIVALLDMAAMNELTIRKGWRVDYDGKKSFSRINQKIANVEATLMYTVGVAITNKLLQCKHCRQKNGPSEYCVQVPGFKECANCHWDKQGPRCSFNDNPQPPRKSRQNNKLSTQEKFVSLDAKMVAFKAQLAAVHANCQNTLDWNPDFSGKSSDEIDHVLPGYCLHFSHQWLHQTTEELAKLREEFTVILEEHRALKE